MTDKPTSFSVVDKRFPLVVTASAETIGGAPPEPFTVTAIEGVTTDAADGKVSVHELYANGLPVGAISYIAPNTALVLPIRKPSVSAGGIVGAVDENKATLGTNAIAYVVSGVGPVAAAADQHPQTWLQIEAGDVVVVRNAMLEALHPDLEPLSIHRRHILSIVRVREFSKTSEG